MNDKELSHYDDVQNEIDFLADPDNCAILYETTENILNIPDTLAVEVIMEWAAKKGYTVTIREGRE